MATEGLLIQEERAKAQLLLDLWELIKPEISFLVAISAVAGFLAGSSGSLDFSLLGALLLGLILAAGGSGALNHYMERHYDGLMRRTANRPLPSGRMQPITALAFGLTLTIAGVIILLEYVNVLTAGLAALTVVLYLLVYTPLKRRTVYNTLIGCIPGALPPLGGWAAATGSLDIGGWILFGILFAWQMPHFLSLAWIYRKDYERGGYLMLPVLEPDGRSTGRQALLYTIIVLFLSLLPALIQIAGLAYLLGALALGLWFLRPAYRFYRYQSTAHARHLLLATIVYIPVLVVLIGIDRLLH